MITDIVYDDRQLVARLSGMTEKIRASLRVELEKLAIDYTEHLVTTKLQGQVLGHRSGNMIRSLHNEAFEDGNTVGQRIYEDDNAWYWILHEFGVPHPWVIRAKNAMALHWTDESGDHFAKQVTHPGLKERAQMRTSLAEMRPSIIEGIHEAVARALES